MSHSRSNNGWAFAVHRGVQGWQGLLADWQALVDCCGEPDMLHQPAWYGAYLQHLSLAPERVVFATAWKDGQLMTVLPLEIRERRVNRITIQEAHLVTHPHMILGDMVANPAVRPDGWRPMLDWLQSPEAMPWDVLNLEAVAEGSCLDNALKAQPSPLTLSSALRTSAWLNCRCPDTQAREHANRSHQTNLRRLRRRASSRAPVRFEVIDNTGHIDPALDLFFGVEGSGWKADRGTAITHHVSLQKFYQSLAHQFTRRAACRVHLLWLGDEVIASQFALVSGRQINILKIGYRESHSDLAPGHLLMQETIEAASMDPGIDRLSFVTHPPWAHLWKPRVTPVFQHRIFNPSWRGWLLHQMMQWRRGH
jgi:CelD/BcsL family acetyltransferase involved in cellulose biosynthesis